MSRILIGAVGALLLACASFAGDQTSKPVRTLHILFVAPESSDALWNEADLVVHVRIAGSRPQATTDGRFVHTVHRARVVDVIKSGASIDCAAQATDPAKCSPAAGQDLTFMQKAGEIETADAVIRLAGETPLKPGSEYVLFLKWDVHLEEFLPFHGPDAAFQIQNGVIHPTGKSPISEEHTGKSVASFKNGLRRKSGER